MFLSIIISPMFRLMLSDLMTASCFVAIPDNEEVALVLRQHVLVS